MLVSLLLRFSSGQLYRIASISLPYPFSSLPTDCLFVHVRPRLFMPTTSFRPHIFRSVLVVSSVVHQVWTTLIRYSFRRCGDHEAFVSQPHGAPHTRYILRSASHEKRCLGCAEELRSCCMTGKRLLLSERWLSGPLWPPAQLANARLERRSSWDIAEQFSPSRI